MEEVEIRIYNLGRADGREDGIYTEKRETAMRLQQEGFDAHKIASIVNASIELICEWLGLTSVTA